MGGGGPPPSPDPPSTTAGFHYPVGTWQGMRVGEATARLGHVPLFLQGGRSEPAGGFWPRAQCRQSGCQTPEAPSMGKRGGVETEHTDPFLLLEVASFDGGTSWGCLRDGGRRLKLVLVHSLSSPPDWPIHVGPPVGVGNEALTS